MEQMSFNQQMTVQPQALSVQGSAAEVAWPARARTTAGAARKPETFKGNVTEIILPEGQVENFQLLLPMLTQLNQEKRWLAWIDPPQELVSKWQKMHGIVANELLVLRSSTEYPALQLAERALGAGTCHAVILWTSRLGKPAFESLQRASAKGRSHGVILRHR
ncbi:cell division inhibitor SulA [Marinobacter oulmenensis]|uniref:Cell division inhibitor SulA n=1 Tax=Marinobacter oulmenensis TaxID=643747 RepID=A0A840UJH9_9GAMM|nr:SulA-like leucine-rich domain-containing protein [Marinobacter oulmenensis]MBB5321286.1 cell division inhibitor SulA [Marinobacter oulmenensis]